VVEFLRDGRYLKGFVEYGTLTTGVIKRCMKSNLGTGFFGILSKVVFDVHVRVFSDRRVSSFVVNLDCPAIVLTVMCIHASFGEAGK
jgi:hypothetical protein